jgi:hypothetical protein
MLRLHEQVPKRRALQLDEPLADAAAAELDEAVRRATSP